MDPPTEIYVPITICSIFLLSYIAGVLNAIFQKIDWPDVGTVAATCFAAIDFASDAVLCFQAWDQRSQWKEWLTIFTVVPYVIS